MTLAFTYPSFASIFLHKFTIVVIVEGGVAINPLLLTQVVILFFGTVHCSVGDLKCKRSAWGRKTNQDSTSWLCCCSLDLTLGETQVFQQKRSSFCNSSAVEEDQRMVIRSSQANGRAEGRCLPLKRCAAHTAPGLRSCKARSTRRAENHLPSLPVEHCVGLQTGNPKAVLVKPTPSTAVTALSHCNIFPALGFKWWTTTGWFWQR